MDLNDLSKLTKRPLFSELLLGRDLRPCERCKEQTYWRKRGQRTRGYCQHHALSEPGDENEAISNVMGVFGGVTVEDFAPEVMAPDTYTTPTKYVTSGRFLISGEPIWATGYGPPPDSGPCAGCGRTIRAYGDDAYAKCKECP